MTTDTFCDNWTICRLTVKDGESACPCFPPIESIDDDWEELF